MDNRYIRVLTLEREVFRLQKELSRLERQHVKDLTILSTVGSMAGLPPIYLVPVNPTPPDEPGPTWTGCLACLSQFPPLQFTDSVYGGPVPFTSPQITTTNHGILSYGMFSSTGQRCFSIMNVSFVVGCSLGYDGPCRSSVSSNELDITSSLNCTHPTMVFTMPPTPAGATNPQYYPYPNGARITVNPI